MKILDVTNIRKTYHTKSNDFPVLKGVNLDVNQGEFVAVVGQSGSGKTTLLNIISGYLRADIGEVRIGKKDIQKVSKDEMAEIRQNDLGFVFQDFMLIDGLTSLENIYLPLTISGKKLADIKIITDKLIETFDLVEVADKYPSELSGGQKQRIAVARALAINPLLILADEPTGNLDSKSTTAVIEAFIKAKEMMNASILMVTHDPVAASYADRIIALSDGMVIEEILKAQYDSDAFIDTIYKLMGKVGEI